MKVFVERKGLTIAELWRGFHDLADDWLWAAGRNLKGRPSTVQPHGRPPRIVYRCLKPSKSDWSRFKMEPAHQTLLALARRIGELIRLIKARPDEAHHAHSALATVQKASRRVREDLASAHFPEGWLHADLEPGTVQGREMLENCEARLKATVAQHLRDMQASRAVSWTRWCQDQLQGSGAAICKWIRVEAHHDRHSDASWRWAWRLRDAPGQGSGGLPRRVGESLESTARYAGGKLPAYSLDWRACRTSRSPRSPCQISGARCGKLRGQAEASTGGPGLSCKPFPTRAWPFLLRFSRPQNRMEVSRAVEAWALSRFCSTRGPARRQRSRGTLASYRAFTGSGAPPGVEWCEPGGPR